LLPKHPSGISWVDLDTKLEQWVKHFGTVLMYSTIHALKLPLFFPRARTHLLYLELLYKSENGGNVGRFFDLDKVDVMLAEAVARTDSVARLNVDRLKAMSDENERDGKGLVSGVALLCKPLKVQMVPIGSITPTGMKRTKWVGSWEQNLRRCIETGDPKFDPDDS
jgi:splicing suppressor protein 51